jgi:hypothetical protein
MQEYETLDDESIINGSAEIDDELSKEKFLNETKIDNTRDRNNIKASHMHHKMKKFIVSGRDDVLLKLLADKMNFKFEYVDVKMMELNGNVTKSDALGLQMLQKRVTCCFLLF